MNKIIENLLSDLDQKQLHVINSSKSKIIVEAPPGYGKTKLLINKTLKDLLNNTPKNHEKVLMLTFSTNSASKMREDLNEELKNLSINLQSRLRAKVLITNFHGFTRSVLSKYGYLLNKELKEIQDYEIIAERQIREFKVKRSLTSYANNISLANVKKITENMQGYNNIVLEELLPYKILTHNSLLTLTIQLFQENTKLLKLYQRLYRKLVIDEFQDTNVLNLILLELFMTENLKIELYGDPLQRIYGFTGTVENIFDKFGEKYKCENYKLEKNYRFKDNKNLLILEKQIRELASKRSKTSETLPLIENPNISLYNNHLLEVEAVVKKIIELKEEKSNKRIVILTPQRGPDIDTLINLLNENQIKHFNALELDTESEFYIEFCLKSAKTFQNHFIEGKKVLKEELKIWSESLESEINDDSLKAQTLKSVLKAFLNHIRSDNIYRNKSQAEKKDFILNTFINKELHLYLSRVDEKVQISTIHTSKGLEWDIVFLVDVEKSKLPNHFGLCTNCEFSSDCKIELNSDNEARFIEQLSLFYVAVTRAKEEVYISGSLTDARGYQTNQSCFFEQLNIKPIRK